MKEQDLRVTKLKKRYRCVLSIIGEATIWIHPCKWTLWQCNGSSYNFYKYFMV